VLPDLQAVASQKRPATGWDALCIVYGIGCIVPNAVWTPDEAYRETVLPSGKPGTTLYELQVPVQIEGGPIKVYKVAVVSAGIDAVKK
jgi:hypothetical protein